MREDICVKRPLCPGCLNLDKSAGIVTTSDALKHHAPLEWTVASTGAARDRSAPRIMSPPRLKVTIRERSRTLGAAAITLVMCLSFFALVGFYRNRLAFNVLVPVVIVSVTRTGSKTRSGLWAIDHLARIK